MTTLGDMMHFQKQPIKTGLFIVVIMTLFGIVATSVNAAEFWASEMIDIDSTGQPATEGSWRPQMSADGRYVVFESNAITSDDADSYSDIFLRDRQTQQTTRISPDSIAGELLRDAWTPFISADGRYIQFLANIRYLQPNNTYSYRKQFIRYDRESNTYESFVGSPNSTVEAGFSANGNCSVFASSDAALVPGDTNSAIDVFLFQWDTRTVSRVNISTSGEQAQSRSNSYAPSISGDCSRVVFSSNAANLVPDDTNNEYDVFLHEVYSHQTVRVSISSTGEQATEESTGSLISGDGRFVVFKSGDNNLVPGDTCCTDIILRNLQTGENRRVGIRIDGSRIYGQHSADAISYDGRYVAFTIYNYPLEPAYRSTRVLDAQTGYMIERFATADGSNPISRGSYNDFSPRVQFPVGSVSNTVIFVDRNSYSPEDTGTTYNIFVARIQIMPPASPTNLVVRSANEYAVVLNWNDRSPDETHYLIERSMDAGVTWAEIAMLPDNSWAYTDTIALCSNIYEYRVRAYRDYENIYSEYSNTASAILPACPNPSSPNALPAVNAYPTPTPTLRWGVVTWAAGYEVQVSNSPQFTTLAFTTMTGALETTTSALSEGTYFWRVRAQRADGTWGVWSAADTFVIDLP